MLWPWMIASFLVACASTPLVAACAVRAGVLDEPKEERKTHARPTPLLGGLAVFVAVVVVTAIALFATDRLTVGLIDVRHYVGFFVGGTILMIGGVLDDRFRLPPSVSFLFPVFAALAAVVGGIEVSKLTNPFGGVLELSAGTSQILVFVWLLVVMYVTKLLDGLDGLDTSVVVTGTVAILFLSLSATYFQPDIALFASIATGALLGFLVWNWYPAKIFLGEGGSTFVGYLLGTLAIISGSKVAMALLVLGIPGMDLLSVVAQRLRGGWHAVVEGDRRHLHYRLLDKGWSQPRVVFFYIIVALLFSLVALALQTR
ncbi:undecaprenyl/decaprenyl-phosphate alpha-N-acetylglucosaminyl 1-phosphate transferase [Candidatus Uhrbacteria bacterium]|nr:undecaprenyl/decaprenyl-phosphate alpha-N-acetylglucosaminyl 1-phosphate transferase [Candidatus Uhrbacteria bacterium]